MNGVVVLIAEYPDAPAVNLSMGLRVFDLSAD